MEVKLSLRWQLGRQQSHELEPLAFDLLTSVERGLSLRRAALEAGVSYRHAWGQMREWEQRLGAALIHLERGKPASLSPLGRSLLWARRRADARLTPALDSVAAEIGHELSSLLVDSRPLRLVASHDLALEQLRGLLADAIGRPFNVQYRGSMDAVRQLVAGRCDLAGYHIPGITERGPIETAFAEALPVEQYRSVCFVGRSQGLILPPANPAGLRSLNDLARPSLRFLNRQSGSGTRLLFDALLKQAGVPAQSINGYDSEEFTHLAVAAMVASGAADAGFGIQAAAERFGLGFVPMVTEHYLFAFRSRDADSDWVKRLLGVLRPDAQLGQTIACLPGYDCSCMGEAWPFGHGCGARPAGR